MASNNKSNESRQDSEFLKQKLQELQKMEESASKEKESRQTEEAKKTEEATKEAESKKEEETAKAAESKKTEEAVKAAESKKTEEAVKAAESKKTEEVTKEAEAKKAEEASRETQSAKDSSKDTPKKEWTPDDEPDESIPDDSDEDLITVDLSPKKKGNKEAGFNYKSDRKSEHKSEHKSNSKTAKGGGEDVYKKKRRKKTIIRLVVIAIILAIIGYIVYVVIQTKKAAQEMLGQATQTTDTIERRDIVNCITTTGTLEAQEMRTLTSTAKDTTIDSVMAEVGDTVYAGQTLVMFSTETINKTISQLQEDLAMQQKKDSIEANASDRSYLFTYSNQATELSNAAAKVESALKALYEACDGLGDAKRAKEKAIEEGKSGSELDVYDSAISTATQQENSAKQAYDTAVKDQANLIAKSGNTLTEADENHEKTAISAGDAATKLRRQIEEYQDKLDNYVITAPISGLVTSVSVEEGNGFSGGTVMVIQNTDSFKISANVSEYDIPNVKLGQKVLIKTDATRDDQLEGVVSFIAPTSTTTTGATSSGGSNSGTSSSSSSGANFEITIDVITKDSRLKIGMTTRLSIILDEVTDVLTVPYDAINTDENGNTYITVQDRNLLTEAMSGTETGEMPTIQIDGQDITTTPAPTEGTKPDMKDIKPGKPGKGGPESLVQTRDIPVQVGLEGDYYTEISSNEISEGMIVVISTEIDNGSDFELMMSM